MIDKFVLAIFSVIGLAWVWPAPGAATGLYSLQTVADLGVTLIFFFYGLRLSPEKLRAGLSNLRLHVLVQASTFLLFPLLALGPYFIWGAGAQGDLWLGIYFLACLPSTVSSSVVMVSIANGNVAGAIFNASLSALIGVFVTPLWMAWVLGSTGEGPALSGVVLKLALQVLLPVVLGLFMHRLWGAWAEKHKARLRLSDQAVILTIIYTAFCDSFAGNFFAGFRWSSLLLLALGMVGLFLLVFTLIALLSRWLGLSREDSITALFCGSKKSLVHGTVMAKVLFAGVPGLGMVLLPLMLYHALQIVLCSVIARKIDRFAFVGRTIP